MRVILDTNVLLSAFIRVNSKPYKLVQAWLDGVFELVSSADQIEEISRVSRYPRVRQLIGPAELGWLVNRIRDRGLIIERLAKVDISSDPADNFLLAMAQAGDAAFLVTGDKSGLLAIRQHLKTRIISTTEFMAEIGLR